LSGKSISLQSGGEKNAVHQTDFMSYAEQEEETMNLNEELEKRRQTHVKTKKKSKENNDDGNEIAGKTDAIANSVVDNENGQGNILDG
jgi:hypothetical protein